jgi:hypothetical protein
MAPSLGLPECFATWFSVWKTLPPIGAPWAFEKIFEALSDEPDLEYAFVDGIIIKIHRHA